jgi:hypothetical protein
MLLYLSWKRLGKNLKSLGMEGGCKGYKVDSLIVVAVILLNCLLTVRYD